MLVTPLPLHVLERELVVVGHHVLDVLDGERPAGAGGDDVLQEAGGGVLVDLVLVDRREGQHPGQRTLQLTDVLLHLVGDEGEDGFGDHPAVVPHLRPEDGEPGLEVGWLDVGQQALLEA